MVISLELSRYTRMCNYYNNNYYNNNNHSLFSLLPITIIDYLEDLERIIDYRLSIIDYRLSLRFRFFSRIDLSNINGTE